VKGIHGAMPLPMTKRISYSWRPSLVTLPGIFMKHDELSEEAQCLAQTETDKARLQNNAKGDFLARMSHEIRTPMNGVLGILQLLKDSQPNAYQDELLRIMEYSGRQLSRVVNDILDYSKLEEGKVEIETIPFDLHALLHTSVAQFRCETSNKTVKIQVETPLNVPLYVMGDPTRLQQVITNLLSNALKFTAQGLVQLSATLLEPCLIRFSVSDSGIGMSASQAQNIFERFVQADTSITRRFGGTGLGLSISQQLVTQMGGEICVESEPDAGSMFWFDINLPPHSLNEESNSGPDSLTRESRPAHILVAEDNPVNRLVVSKLLNRLGHTVHLVENGKEALKAITEGHEFSLILMDCEMPVMDGFTASKNILQWEAKTGCSPTPIIALSAHGSTRNREKCLAVGMREHIPKPLEISQLKKVIDAQLI